MEWHFGKVFLDTECYESNSTVVVTKISESKSTNFILLMNNKIENVSESMVEADAE
jgi:hypothetical protein